MKNNPSQNNLINNNYKGENQMETKKIKTETTNKGYHAMWESGGGATNTGEATIIADENGRRKQAIYVKRTGHLANSNHALIIVEPGDIIIKSYHKRKDFWIRVWKIIGFDGEYAVSELIYEFSKEKWDKEPPEFLTPAIETSKAKATCYHCRSAHFCLQIEGEKK